MLWQRLADESASRCCTSATLDFKRVQCRFEHEGLSFLTITLPTFGKDFQKSLDQGYVDRRLFAGFRRKGGLPRFLGGFLDRVFDRNSGVLLDEPDIDAILAIRQLTLMFGKILKECSDARRKDAISEFIQCEQEVRDCDLKRTPIDLERFRSMSQMLFGKVFTRVDHAIYYGEELVPKHGPGSTADRLIGNEKYRQQTWPSRLENIFPMGEMLLPNWRYYDQLAAVDLLEPGSEIPVRVITVPKTLKTPRIIGMEPTAMQYAQQAVLAILLRELDRDDLLSRVIGFDDQTPNQRMAQEGSAMQSLATLDLSEASDRVSNQLVREMTSNWPYLHEALDASRSRKADVPGHGVIRMAKFACMGSALCFPVEAMVFTTLIFMGIEQSLNTTLDPRTVNQYKDQVRVYGDDIIVPVDHVRSVVDMLTHFGAKVNIGKSYWTGRFRESCGKEFYGGHDVSIVKVRREFPAQRKDAAEVISLVSLRNQLYWAGYWSTVKWLDDEIRDVIRYFPTVLPSSPVLGRHSVLGYVPERIGTRYHDPQVRGYVVEARLPENSLSEEGALLKFFHRSLSRDTGNALGSLPAVDVDHLERSGRPHAVNIKLRWKSAI